MNGPSLSTMLPWNFTDLTPALAPRSRLMSTDESNLIPTFSLAPPGSSWYVMGPNCGGVLPNVSLLTLNLPRSMLGKLSLTCGTTCSCTIFCTAASMFGQSFVKRAFSQPNDSLPPTGWRVFESLDCLNGDSSIGGSYLSTGRCPRESCAAHLRLCRCCKMPKPSSPKTTPNCLPQCSHRPARLQNRCCVSATAGLPSKAAASPGLSDASMRTIPPGIGLGR
mmetsp:Transcript_4773/g.9492  ORF Transcript_4773/g.9492 Transcript_4773/m.9492 type:complete len:222 (+) Transcript_4773:122-787(+)